jgi:glucose/arabinose dehydrogenase
MRDGYAALMSRRAPMLVGLMIVVAACAGGSGTVTMIPTTAVVPATAPPTTTTASTSAASSATTSGTQTTPPTTAAPTTAAPRPPLVDFELALELVVDDLRQPVLVVSRRGDRSQFYVLEQPGSVLVMDPQTGDRATVLDIEAEVRSGGERGLLGLAFHPNDPDRFYVHYSGEGGATVIEEYRIDPISGVADPTSARLIFTIPQPADNHNGGMLAFGPDGYLYIGLGDGGGSDDTYGNGQDPFSVLGAILRIDIDGGDPYAIPPDNPFADGLGGAPEIWAWGMRNPWRFWFDGSDLWVGDVGQNMWEEIDLFDASRGGDNGGWPTMEGLHCLDGDACDPSPFLTPVIEYSHGSGRCSVTGGVVYRGSAIPQLTGTYLWGDYCSGEIWGLRFGDEPEQRLFTGGGLPAVPGLTSFGVGPDGEVYVAQEDGRLWRVVPAG